MAGASKQNRKKEPAPPATAPQARLPWRPHLARLAAIWLLALAACSNSFRAGLVFDNGVIILRDTRIRALTAENLRLIFSSEYWSTNNSTGLYRPFTTLTYLFNWAVLGNGDSPAGYHWINFGLHALNIGLVYALGLLLFGEGAGAGVMAGVMAVLWAVHPVLTESVTNVVGRADLLAAASVLAGLLCYARARRVRPNQRGYWLTALGLIAAAGIFSKESAVALAAAMPLWDWTSSESVPWKRRWPAYAVLAPGYLLFFWLRGRMLAGTRVAPVTVLDNPLMGADFWTARATAIKALGLGLWKMCWPQHLSADYSYNQILVFGWKFNTWQDWQAIIGLLVCLAAAGVAVWGFRRAKPVFFLIGLTFAALAPTANLLLRIGTIFAERFLYLPAVGLAGLAALALGRICRGRTTPLSIAGVLALVLAVRTWLRNDDWRDERALFTAVTADSPYSAKGHFLLASMLVTGDRKLVGQALEQGQRAIEILQPLPDAQTDAGAYYITGMCQRLEGDDADPAARADWYRKALENLLRARAIDRAQRQQQDAIRSDNVPTYLELGRVYERIGQPEKAIPGLLFGRALRPIPEFSEELSRVYADTGDMGAAARSLIEGLLIDPAAPRLTGELGSLYRQAYPRSCAVGQAGANASIDTGCPLVRGEICDAARHVAEAYRAVGLSAKAAEALRSAASNFQCPAM
jgi:tetratricopeptide (TPR) repeat protein